MMDEQEKENYKHGNKYQVIFYLSEDEYKRLKQMRKKLDPFKAGSFNQFIKALIIRWAKAW